MEQYIWVLNILGIGLGLKLLYDFGPLFRTNKSILKGNVDLVETSYFIILFSIIGNVLFLSNEDRTLYQLLGGLASCFIHLFLGWAMKKKYGNIN